MSNCSMIGAILSGITPQCCELFLGTLDSKQSNPRPFSHKKMPLSRHLLFLFLANFSARNNEIVGVFLGSSGLLTLT